MRWDNARLTVYPNRSPNTRYIRKRLTRLFYIIKEQWSLRWFFKTGTETRCSSRISSATRNERLDSGDLVVKDQRVLRWNTRPNITLRQVDQYSSDGRRSAQHAGSLASRSVLLRVSRSTVEKSVTRKAYWSHNWLNEMCYLVKIIRPSGLSQMKW